MSTEFRILSLGDAAFTVEFTALKGAAGARHVRGLKQQIESDIETGGVSGIVDMISASRSLTVCLDPLVADYGKVRVAVSRMTLQARNSISETATLWTLPVSYDDLHSPDLGAVSQATGMEKEDIIRLHSAGVYDVLMVGFLPGFPFMASIPESLRLPRRTSPRLQVPAGSVAIANDQTAIYPWESPGGWHLIGHCPVPLFNADWAQPGMLSAGDQVQFEPVDIATHNQIADELSSGRTSISRFRSEPA